MKTAGCGCSAVSEKIAASFSLSVRLSVKAIDENLDCLNLFAG